MKKFLSFMFIVGMMVHGTAKIIKHTGKGIGKTAKVIYKVVKK